MLLRKKLEVLTHGAEYDEHIIHDEAEGFEEEGIAPGTAWEDVPEDWVCPECGVGKADFEMIEID